MQEAVSTEKIESSQPNAPSTTVETIKRTYRAGTLEYTMTGLIVLSFWLMWGDFCLVMLESVLQRIFPLALESGGASKSMTGFLVGSVPAVLSMTMMPWVAIRSDRYRSSLGRRIPFLLWSSPLAAGLLIAVGYSHPISELLSRLVMAVGVGLSPTTLSIMILCILIVSFHIFNSIMLLMYNTLLADVIPREVMGRFVSILRSISMAAKVVFSYYIFGLYEHYPRHIFVGIGLLYLASFTIMCWRVREGQYPPPPEPNEKMSPSVGRFHSLKVYLKESFTSPYYLSIFLFGTLYGLSGCVVPFFIFFYKNELNLDLDSFGKLHALGYLCQALLCVPAGYLCDKLHPIRATMIGLLWTAAGNLGFYFFVHDWNSLVVCMIFNLPGSILTQVGTSILYVNLFPRTKFAQFCSALGQFSAINLIIGNIVAGKLIDWTGNYRMPYLWSTITFVLAIVPLIYIFIKWKQYGGAKNYVPPEVNV